MAIVIDGDVYEVGELRLEKSLRIIDALAALTRSSNAASEVVQDWIDREMGRRREQLEALPPAELEARRRLAEVQVAEELPELEEADALVEVERRMRNVEPSFGEKLTRVLPYVWKEGRAELDALLALAIADIAEMEQADARGVLDQYLASKSRMLRYRGSLATAIAILQALALRVREEIAEQGSLGEVISAFSGAISGLTGTTGSSASEPDTSTASEPTTAGTEATSSTEPPSQSSTDSLG